MEYIHGKESLLPRVTAVTPLEGYKLSLTFKNGEKRTYDASALLSLPAYKSLKNVFPAARVEFGTVTWPGDMDISPETLYLRSVPTES